MEPEPLSRENSSNNLRTWAAVYAGLALTSLVLNFGSDVKAIAANAWSAAGSRLDGEYKAQTYGYECSPETHRVRVTPGDSQWAIEQRKVKGANLVPRDIIGTKTIEQNPGDGILQPGDTVIVPKWCRKTPIQQS